MLEYDEGKNMFLISDSDVPFNSVQGQFVWVEASEIVSYYTMGASIISSKR